MCHLYFLWVLVLKAFITTQTVFYEARVTSEDAIQCDQTGLFLKILSPKRSYKNLDTFWGVVKMTTFITTAVATFIHILKKIGLIFIWASGHTDDRSFVCDSWTNAHIPVRCLNAHLMYSLELTVFIRWNLASFCEHKVVEL